MEVVWITTWQFYAQLAPYILAAMAVYGVLLLAVQVLHYVTFRLYARRAYRIKTGAELVTTIHPEINIDALLSSF